MADSDNQDQQDQVAERAVFSQEPEGIFLFYHRKRNPEGCTIRTVPMRDLSEDEYQALPEHLQAAVTASGYWDTAMPAGWLPQADWENREAERGERAAATAEAATEAQDADPDGTDGEAAPTTDTSTSEPVTASDGPVAGSRAGSRAGTRGKSTPVATGSAGTLTSGPGGSEGSTEAESTEDK